MNDSFMVGQRGLAPLHPPYQSEVSNYSAVHGRHPGIRTQTVRGLNPTPLPIGLDVLEAPEGFEPSLDWF